MAAPKITTFDRANLREFQTALLQAMADVGNRYGVLIEFGSGRFEPTSAYSKVLFKLIDPAKPGAVKVPKFPSHFALTEADIGKTVTFSNGTFRIEGYDPRKRTKCVVLSKDGKIGYHADAATVLSLLGRGEAPTRAGRVSGNYPGEWDKLPNESFDAYSQRTDALLKAIPQDKILRFPRGDGYAMYFVQSLRPLKLQHIPYGDAWTADPMTLRGLTVADAERMMESNRAMSRLFASR